jgi:hypothetical protein
MVLSRLNVRVPMIDPHIPKQCMLLNNPIIKATRYEWVNSEVRVLE